MSDISDLFNAAAILAQRDNMEDVMVSEVGEDAGGGYSEEIIVGEDNLLTSGEELVLADDDQQEVVLMDSEDVLLGDEGVIGQQEVVLGGEEVIADDEKSELSVPLINTDDEEEGKLIDSDDSEDSDTRRNSDGSLVISDVETPEPPEDVPAKVSARKRNYKATSGKRAGKRPPRNKKKRSSYHSGPTSGASKLFLCPYCDQSGYNLEMIHSHISESHPQSGKYKCDECTYASDFDYGLEIHSVIHSSQPPYHCSECSFKCNMDFQMNKHINTHTGEKNFKCNQCDYGTDHTTNYRRHMERHSFNHGTSCSYCSYSCTNVYQLNRHVENSHKDKVGDGNQNSSKVESKRPKSESAKKEPKEAAEVKEEAEDGEQDTDKDGVLSCTKCSFTTRYASNMVKHMVLHDGGSAEQVSCHLCSYTTVVKSNLKRHCKAAHAGQTTADGDVSGSQAVKSKKPVYLMPRGISLKRDTGGHMTCEVCGYKTAWHTNLKRHYATHEPKVCALCGFSSMDRNAYVKHMRAHDGGTAPASDSDTESKDISSSRKVDGRDTIARTRERRVATKKVDEEFIEGSDIDETFQEHKLINKRPSSRSSNVSSRNSLNTPHNRVQDKFHCTKCDFSCNHDTWLETHMKQHAIGKTTHKCQYCGYTAPNPHRLKAHMMTHTGCKPYKCPRCDFASSNSSNLYRHIRKKHDPEDVELAKNQKIDVPDSSSDEEAEPEEEVAEDEPVSPEPADSEEEKTRGDRLAQPRGSIPLVIFRCNECEFTTVSRESLSEHKEVHTIADLVEAANSSDEGGSETEETEAEPKEAEPQEVEPQEAETVIEEPVISDVEVSGDDDQETQAPAQSPQTTQCPPTTKPSPSTQSPPTSESPPTTQPSDKGVTINDRRGKLPVWKLKMAEKQTSASQAELASAPGSPPVKVRREPTSYACPLCPYTHSLQARVSLHCTRRHYGTQPYRCKLCSLRTLTMYHVNRHRLLAHNLRMKTVLPRRVDTSLKVGARDFKHRPIVCFTCKRCGFDTNDKDYWGKHLNQHARDQIKLLQEQSPKPAARKKEVSPHASADSSFACSECDFTCRRKDMYTAHIKQHSKKAVVAKCDQCPYTTSNPYNLMKHKRTHTGEKPFKCNYCTYRSADSGNLNKHINSHHGKEGGQKRSSLLMMKKKKVKKAAAFSATKPAGEIPKLTKPSTSATPKQAAVKLEGEGSMLFKCTECDYQCPNEDFLIAHLSIHKKQGDQYVCAICDYFSRNQQNLAKHIRTHTGEKPYQCTHCNYSAADKGNLNKHVKTHHKKEETDKKPDAATTSQTTDQSVNNPSESKSTSAIMSDF